MQIEISKSCVETMLKSRIILDYTNDGWGRKENGQWVPLGDIIEYHFSIEPPTRIINVVDNKVTKTTRENT